MEQNYLHIIKEYLQTNPPNFGNGNAQSILDMLYVHYMTFNNFESIAAKASFDMLYNQLNQLSLKEMDAIIDTVCELCTEYQHDAFLEGIKVGVRLGTELNQ